MLDLVRVTLTLPDPTTDLPSFLPNLWVGPIVQSTLSCHHLFSMEREIRSIIDYRKRKLRHNDFINHSISMRFKHKYTKGIFHAISIRSEIIELGYKVGKLTEKYEENMGIT